MYITASPSKLIRGVPDLTIHDDDPIEQRSIACKNRHRKGRSQLLLVAILKCVVEIMN